MVNNIKMNKIDPSWFDPVLWPCYLMGVFAVLILVVNGPLK